VHRLGPIDLKLQNLRRTFALEFEHIYTSSRKSSKKKYKWAQKEGIDILNFVLKCRRIFAGNFRTKL